MLSNSGARLAKSLAAQWHVLVYIAQVAADVTCSPLSLNYLKWSLHLNAGMNQRPEVMALTQRLCGEKYTGLCCASHNGGGVIYGLLLRSQKWEGRRGGHMWVDPVVPAMGRGGIHVLLQVCPEGASRQCIHAMEAARGRCKQVKMQAGGDASKP